MRNVDICLTSIVLKMKGLLLLARTIAVTFCQTLAAAMAARLGTTPMAAFQICLQVWLTSSLLNDGLAVAGQVIMFSRCINICIVYMVDQVVCRK